METMQRLNCGFEVKLANSDKTTDMIFGGYGAVFGNVDSYGDVIAKGAFKDAISEAKKTGQWPSMLSQHGGWGITADDLTPIGVWTDMSEDDIGLKLDGKLAEITRGKEAYTLLKMTPRPALNGLSIGYIPKAWEVGTKPDEPRRTLTKIDLLEISLVTFPANPKARVQSVKSGTLTKRELEHALRDAGCSQQEAKTILSRGWDALGQRDVDELSDLKNLVNQNINRMTRK